MSTLITEAKLNFKIGKKIGKGGEGDVFEAEDHQLNATLAVKKVAHSKFSDESLFFEESKKLYLTRHRNVVEVNYGCKDDDHIYLAMPFYQNGSLKDICDSRFLSSREIIRYGLQFLSGLHHIHSKGLIHFDVKLENILISKSNQALISDFGLAQYTGRYGFSKVFGTTQVYAPPELFDQAEHNLKFDIYQAGITLLRMCIGDNVFSHQINQAFIKRNVKADAHFIERLKSGQFPDRSSYFSHIPKPLRKVIANALHPNPSNRYDTVLEMQNDLAKIKDSNDWLFNTDFKGNDIWTDGNREVKATFDGANWTVKSTKNKRQKKDFCKAKLNNSEKNSLLYKAFMSNW